MAQELFDKLILILIAVTLIPTVFTFVSDVNWTLSVGGTELNLGFVGIIMVLAFGLLGIGYKMKLGSKR